MISVGLLGFAGMSACVNSGSEDAGWRIVILMASGLGGFWSARILINSPFRQRAFAWLCLVSLTGVIALSLRHYLETGTVDYFLYSRSHPLIQMLFLLSAGPIALLDRRHALQSLLGVLVLVGVYVTLYLIGVDDTRSAVLIPMAVLALFAMMASFGSRLVPAAFVLLLLVSCVTAHYASTLSNRGLGQYQEYRLESYPFSWHIAQQYPVAGIGLRTARDGFLADYHVTQPDYPGDLFDREVRYLVTSENLFLTLMVGMGFPFLMLYGTALLSLLGRLVRMVFRPPEDAVFHPLALLLPLAASVLHSLTTDALLYPQINWYFHVLLGLIPCRPAYGSRVTVSWKAVLARAAGAAAVVVAGLFVGSQAFLSEMLGAKEAPPSSSVSATVSHGRPGQERPVAGSGSPVRSAEPVGTLNVTIEDYKGSHVGWQLMLMVDNSNSMVAERSPWQPNRAQAASDFVVGLAGALPSTAQVAVRDFTSEFFGRKGTQEIPFRVSRLLCPWDQAPFERLGRVVSQIDLVGNNDLCNAAASSIRMDFRDTADSCGRLLLFTDGSTSCSWARTAKLVRNTTPHAGVIIDVLALGMADGDQEPYRNLVSMTGGEFMNVTNPSQVEPTLRRYSNALRRLVQVPVELRGFAGQYKVLPGEDIAVPPGPYSLVLPLMDGLDPSMRTLPQRIRVKQGQRTDVTVSVQGGEPRVR